MQAADCDVWSVTFLKEWLVGEVYAASRSGMVHTVFDGAAPDTGLRFGSAVSANGEIEFNGRIMRGKVYAILGDCSRLYSERLANIYGDYGISFGDDEAWLKTLSELEYLDEGHRNLFMNYSSVCRPDGVDQYLERFLAYLIYRHCTEAFDAEDFALRLSFCLFCERLAASLIAARFASSLCEIAVLMSSISEELEYSEENTEALTVCSEAFFSKSDRDQLKL